MASHSVVYHMLRELAYADVDTVNSDVHALLRNGGFKQSLVPNTGMFRGQKLFGLWGTVPIRFMVRTRAR